MQSIAAYYVFVASDVANQASRKARYEHPAPKRSRLSEIVAAFTRPVRRAAAAAAA